jgi:hypothetical protein
VHSLRVSEEGVFVFQCVFVFFVIEAAAMHCVNLKRALNFVTMRGMYSRMHVLYLDIFCVTAVGRFSFLKLLSQTPLTAVHGHVKMEVIGSNET